MIFMRVSDLENNSADFLPFKDLPKYVSFESRLILPSSNRGGYFPELNKSSYNLLVIPTARHISYWYFYETSSYLDHWCIISICFEVNGADGRRLYKVFKNILVATGHRLVLQVAPQLVMNNNSKSN